MSRHLLARGCLLATFALLLALSTARATDDPGNSIEERLREPVSIDFRDMPARQLLEALCGAANIPITVDYIALAHEEIDLDHPISLVLDQIWLKSALKLLLNKVGATYRVEGGVLRVTTKAALLGPPIVRLYAVQDLVTCDTEREKLGELLRATISPRTWASNGGKGRVGFIPIAGCMIVWQCADIQEEIKQFLAMLRMKA